MKIYVYPLGNKTPEMVKFVVKIPGVYTPLTSQLRKDVLNFLKIKDSPSVIMLGVVGQH